MPTAVELGREWETKAAELDAWLAPKKTDAGFDFQGDDLTGFNDRQGELAKKYDAWQAQEKAEAAAHEFEHQKAALSLPNRLPLFGGNDKGATKSWEGKSLAELFMATSAYHANAKSVGAPDPHMSGKTQYHFFADIEGATVNDLQKAEQSAAQKATITAGMGVIPYVQQTQVVPYAIRRPVIADLIPQSQATGPVIFYPEETVLNLNAAPVAEGGVKPQSDFTVTRQTVNVEVIAHRFKVSNQALEDIPGFQDLLNQRGTLGIALTEEDQILNGNGTSPQLQGFLTKGTVQTQPAGGDDKISQFRRAMTKVQTVGYANPTAGIMNPLDWQAITLYKDTTGRFIFGDPGQTEQAARLWGVPIVATVAMVQGTFLTGDFQMYARLWRKAGLRVLVGWSGDDIDRNLQTIIIEERIALEIDRGSAFCKGTGMALQ